MGKKSKKKKNADFKKVKLKVGRKLPKGKDVDLSFATKRICIREDKPLITDSAGQKTLYLSRIVPRLHSRHNEELISGLTDLKLWIKQSPDEARQLLLMEMQTGIVPLMRHIEPKVRDVARQVFTSLLHVVGNTSAYFPSLAQAMFSALVHIDVGVRSSGWEYLRLMIDVAPRLLPALNCGRLLGELSRRIPQECIGMSSKRTSSAVKLMERLLQILSPAAGSDVLECGPVRTDGILSPTRACLFDWDPSGADRLWLNGHLPRAAECGLGWAGEEVYTLTNFLEDLSSWFFGQTAEFQNIEDPISKLDRSAPLIDFGARLMSLLSILKIALRHHVFVTALSSPAFSRFADSVALVWALFPIADDATIFCSVRRVERKDQDVTSIIRAANMTILHIKCLLLLATDGEGGDEVTEEKKLGKYFNSAMSTVWPPSRALCLQWTTLAELCLRPQLVQRRAKWTRLLVLIVEKIAECHPQKGSKVGSLCRQIVDVHRDMTFQQTSSELE